MKEIPLTRGKVAIVDNEDFEWLNQWKWYVHYNGSCWHALRKIADPVLGWPAQKKVWMHRFIANTPDGQVTDHINGDGLDNRKANLRNVEPYQNHLNRAMNKNNTTGVKGVRTAPGGKFRAYISFRNESIFFPTRETLEEAKTDRELAEIKYFGEFRRK